MSKTAKFHKKHLLTFRKFLVTHGAVESDGDIPVFITFLGTLVVYIIASMLHAAKTAAIGVYKAICKVSKVDTGGLRQAFINAFKQTVTNVYFRLFVFFDNRKSTRKLFKKRRRQYGLTKAIRLYMSDLHYYMKKNSHSFVTFANVLAPAAAVIVFAVAVNTVSASSFGVSVISGGETLGVVSAEDVYMSAARAFSEQTAYKDVENSTGEAFVTARLEITPTAEVMDANSLAAVMMSNASVIMPDTRSAAIAVPEPLTAPAPVSETSVDIIPDIAGKVKAYGVTVDGEFLGAIDDTKVLSIYLNGVKESGFDPEAIDITFDREIEYSYEQFYYPEEIVDESDIIKKLSGTREAAVFVTVESGDNPWDIAMANNLTLSELLECPAEYEGEVIEDLSKFCPVGATIQLSEEVPYLSLLVTKPRTYEVAIDYEIMRSYDDSMYQGETKVTTKGEEGVELVEANVTYRDGKAVSRQILSRTVVTEPVTQVEIIGTKEPKTMVATGGGSGTYFWPVAGGYISAYMGDGRGHKGLDIAAPYGTHIYAAAQGKVTRVGSKGDGYGIAIFITNSDGNVTVYAHMSSTADIVVGDTVVAGQLIGYVGSTGNSTGNHLHFEVRQNGTYLNPTKYVSQY
ncbi:MAG: peptidoglycan DD-metalloendopeptidase family protein [Ruminococcus sp.]|nr:peptidoglycan DD-metalloendopeptidase family protein [Ruminococcus sp.]